MDQQTNDVLKWARPNLYSYAECHFLIWSELIAQQIRWSSSSVTIECFFKAISFCHKHMIDFDLLRRELDIFPDTRNCKRVLIEGVKCPFKDLRFESKHGLSWSVFFPTKDQERVVVLGNLEAMSITRMSESSVRSSWKFPNCSLRRLPQSPLS